MKEVQAPNQIYIQKNIPKLFLAGTIDNGQSENWQKQIVADLADYQGYILNPRRDDWDPKASEEEVGAQINWELKHLQIADVIFMNFLPDSKSPVTLLEMGLAINNPTWLYQQLIIVCPKEYYRHANVYETFYRYQKDGRLKFAYKYETGLTGLKKILNDL